VFSPSGIVVVVKEYVSDVVFKVLTTLPLIFRFTVLPLVVFPFIPGHG
jgi:hypothetical protein